MMDEIKQFREYLREAIHANINVLNRATDAEERVAKLEEEITRLRAELEKAKGDATAYDNSAQKYFRKLDTALAKVVELEESMRHLLEDVNEAQLQSHFTNKAHGWLRGFKQRLLKALKGGE